jgi:hypothetical protein
VKGIKNNKLLIGYIALFVGFLTLFLSRSYYQIPYVSNWDTVDFVLGVEQFDLLKMQPHFPGYPYFIVGGMLFNQFIEHPLFALISFNQTLLISSSLPIYFLARINLKQGQAWFLVLLVQSISYVSLLSTQAMSEAAAIAISWWFIWSVQISLHHRSLALRMIPLFLFSILLGIRLSYIPFGIALLFLVAVDWRSFQGIKRINRIVIQIFFAIFFQFIWVAALAASEGGWRPFLALAFGFVNGHFQDWGGTATVDESNIVARTVYLISNNLFWNGLFSQELLLLSLYLVAIITFIFVIKSSTNVSWQVFDYLLITVFSANFFWALLAQNIEKPRHIGPLLGIFCFLIFVKILQVQTRRKFIYPLLVGIVSAQLYVGINNMSLQQKEAPAVYQLADYFSLNNEKVVLYTWEETRVLSYLDVPFKHERVFTFEYFLQAKKRYADHHIYLTNKVVAGFQSQGIDISNTVQEVKTFSSSSFIDPVYHTITVYKWTGLEGSREVE